MADDSFKYTLHDHGKAEERIGNNNDVYIFLRDRMDLELFRLERDIKRDLRKEIMTSFWLGILVSNIIFFMALYIRTYHLS